MNMFDFKKLPIMGIMRGITMEMVEPIVNCVVSAGLKTVEITMNTQGAENIISKMVSIAREKLIIGAGTVLTMTDLKKALNAGASFIVMPVTIDEIVLYCVNHNIPVFPGALTPNEIYHAWNLGATMVKVFPAKSFGTGYFKEVKAPLDEVKLMATGGVSSDNVKEFIDNGADAISFGAGIFKKEWLQKNQYEKVECEIKKLISNYKSI